MHLALCASCWCISYMHPSRASSSLHHSVCKIESASWQLHRVISTISIAHKTFRLCIAPALQSYISRVHHYNGHRAYASRIIPFNLINSLSKNVLEQKTHLDIFSIKIHHQIEKLILSGLGSSLLCKILLYVSTRIINRPLFSRL